MIEEQGEALGTLYWRDPYTDSVHTTIVTTKFRVGKSEYALAPPKAVYVSSKTVSGLEVVYGSLLHSMDEAVRPIYRVKQWLKEMHDLHTEHHSGNVIELGGKNRSLGLIPGEDTTAHLHKQEAVIKDALLLTAVHVRTLLEDFSGMGNVSIPVYDREGIHVDTIFLSEVFNTLAHYRYCVMSGPFVHDIFSMKGQLGADNLVGAKLRTHEIFEAAL